MTPLGKSDRHTMCGIFGVIASNGRTPSITVEQATRLRDLLTHRGPDGAGVWSRENAILAHRRLAVIDPTPAGAQPFVADDQSCALVYNGELYNDASLRRALVAGGHRFRTACDTETVFNALREWGQKALPKLRGMFAIAFYDAKTKTLLLARDAMGVKPLYFTVDDREVAFASEPEPLLRMPGFTARPNMAMVSAYLTTIRTTLGNETLFQDVLCLAPGQAAVCDLSGDSPVVRVVDWWQGVRSGSSGTDAEAPAKTREVIEDSVLAHLRSDVPMCCLLSGGLDSTITTLIASGAHERLRTYCAGARIERSASEAEAMFTGDDLDHAREAAAFLGVDHSEAIVTRDLFRERWPDMVRRMGVPLSTPNEVAILAVAERLRADGCVVTISGEGADELFAGYDAPMRAAAEFVALKAAGGKTSAGGRFEYEANAWAPPSMKPLLLTPDAWQACDHDRFAAEFYEREFSRCALEATGDASASSLDAHLRFHRRVNLAGLLQRLDSATMLASVEGRTPFADSFVARVAEGLPMSAKFSMTPGVTGGGGAHERAHGGVAVDAPPVLRTKIALREAFRDRLPARIADRPKASFPLPFQAWVEDQAGALRRSEFSKAVFSESVVEVVASDPTRNWRLAWPMINIAMWGERWWG